MTDFSSENPRSFGFVELRIRRSAKRAVEEMNGKGEERTAAFCEVKREKKGATG